jgi:hypothetical protein
MGTVNADTTLEELAALVSQALEHAGIVGTLSGGGAVALYSDNEYLSHDLDFVTSERITVIGEAVAPLGFLRVAGARQFEHPESPLYVEFPPGPIAFGETTFSDDDATIVQTPYGPVRIVTPTQIVMDRLSAYVHWHDNQSFDQALLVVRRQHVDWQALGEWARTDGVDDGVIDKLWRQAEAS